MIEQALFEHLCTQAPLLPFLATYDGGPAIFSQEAPSDKDSLWEGDDQYGRIVFAVDLQGDPERTMGGSLAVDIMCRAGHHNPEDFEPVVRSLIHGWFFSGDACTAAAQWKNSSYFTETGDEVIGCTLTFDLLAFPVITLTEPDIVRRFNRWTSDRFPDLHVINHDRLPDDAWTPGDGDSAVYWRVVTDAPAAWIPDTFQTIWRMATVRCHIFAEDQKTAGDTARMIQIQLYSDKRIFRDNESPIMTNRRVAVDFGADPLKTGQITVEATYAVIVHSSKFYPMNNINVE